MYKQIEVPPYNATLLGIEWNTTLKHATTWVQFKSVVLKERSHPEQDVYCIYKIYTKIWKKQK